MQAKDKENFEMYRSLVSDIKQCVLTTRENGELRGRPMHTCKVEEDGSIWFFTNEYSAKVDEISEDSKVFLTYADPSKNCFVIINGEASLHDDQETIDKLWNDSLENWFPEGKEDPKIMIVCVKPLKIEYWNNPTNKVVLVYELVKSFIKGKPFIEDTHVKIETQGLT